MINVLLNDGTKLNLVSFSFPSHLVLNAESFKMLDKLYDLFLDENNLTKIIVSDDTTLLAVLENVTLEGSQAVKDNDNYYLHVYLTEHKNLTIRAQEELKNKRAENFVNLFGDLTENITEKTTELKNKISSLAQNLTDAESILYKELYKKWSGDSVKYAQNEKVLYGEILYKCLSEHTSQESWSPTNATSLWAKVLTSETGEIKEWEQPDSTNPYMKKDRVKHNNKIYESLIDNNVWMPTAVGTENLWKLVENEG